MIKPYHPCCSCHASIRLIEKIFLIAIIIGFGALSAHAQKTNFPTLDFGDVAVGSSKTINTGICTLACPDCTTPTLTGFQITGADAAEFSTTFGTLVGRDLPPGQCASYTVTLTPTKTGSHQAVLDISSTHASGGALVPLLGGCPVSPLTVMTDAESLSFEAGKTIDKSRLKPAVLTALNCFETGVANAGGNTSNLISSAFRPSPYQAHLREVYVKWQTLKNKSILGCQSLKTQLQEEFTKHDLGSSKKTPASPTGPHTTGSAFDVNMGTTGLTRSRLDELAGACNLHRPWPIGDPVHFQLKTGSSQIVLESNGLISEAAQDLVRVKVYSQSLGGRVFYRYRVINNSGRAIVGLRAGIDQTGEAKELIVPPVAWDYFTGLPLNSTEAPAGWDSYVVTTEESDFISVAWDIQQKSAAIPAGPTGPTQSGFGVTVPQTHTPYHLGHWAIILDDTTVLTSTLELESAPSSNPIENSSTFVTQHYDDFLNRIPDQSGLAFWTNEITSCGTSAQCIEVKRINVSAAFFQSIEFQNTGYLVYRFYKAAYGDTTSAGVPGTVPILRLEDFLPDTQRLGQGVVVNVGNWQEQLEANKTAFGLEFVQRPRFTNAYPSNMTPTAFVDQLDKQAGNVLSASERIQLINELTANNTIAGRASIMRKVADNPILSKNEFNRAFVLTQYYGYLRRNPDDLPNTNFSGWKFWLDKLNNFNGNFVNAEMVKAFITSTEYRHRFGH